ncbi:MAG: transcriptional regulator [Paenibacillaceae bacterium]|jgi:AraC-like DNA-binding protein|nr:transcriptional regulator [Paenibacillaceae bacterium]
MSLARVIKEKLNYRLVVFMLLIAVIPVVGFGSLIYVSGIGIIEGEVNRSSSVALKQIIGEVDSRLRQIEQSAAVIALQPEVVKLMGLGELPLLGSMLEANSLNDHLVNFSNSHDSVDSVYFYHAGQRTVISPRQISSVSEESVALPGSMLDVAWLPELGRAASAKEQSIWLPPRQLQVSAGTRLPVITYIKLLPIFYEEIKGALIVNVSIPYLKTLVERYPFDTSGGIAIFTEDGRLIAGGGILEGADSDFLASLSEEGDSGTRNVSWKEHPGTLYVTESASSLNGWIYTMAIPAEQPTRSVVNLKHSIQISTAALASLALLLSLFSYYRIQAPIARIIKVIRRKEGGAKSPEWDSHPDFFRRIEYRITELMQEMDEVRAQWHDQLPLLRDHFLLSALSGNLPSLEKMIKDNQLAGLFEYPYFVVMVLRSGPLNDRSSFRQGDEQLLGFAIANIVKEKLQEQAVIETVAVSMDIVAILNLPGGRPVDLVREAEAVRHTIRLLLKESVAISIGRKVDSLTLLSRSYQDASQALQFEWLKTPGGVVSYEAHLGEAPQFPSYPAGEATAVLEAVKNRTDEQVSAELNGFHDALRRQSPSLSYMKMFYLQLLVSLTQLVHEYDLELHMIASGRNPYDELFCCEDGEALRLAMLGELLLPAKRQIEGLRSRKSQEIMQHILTYIHKRYAQELSLNEIASDFQVTPSYISQLFKEKYGETYISYLTRYRIETAKQKLAGTELTMAQIAHEVGYTNAQQLIRVFKKLEGMTPGEYRQQQLADSI